MCRKVGLVLSCGVAKVREEGSMLMELLDITQTIMHAFNDHQTYLNIYLFSFMRSPLSFFSLVPCAYLSQSLDLDTPHTHQSFFHLHFHLHHLSPQPVFSLSFPPITSSAAVRPTFYRAR